MYTTPEISSALTLFPYTLIFFTTKQSHFCLGSILLIIQVMACQAKKNKWELAPYGELVKIDLAGLNCTHCCNTILLVSAVLSSCWVTHIISSIELSNEITKNEARIRARIRVFLMLIPYHFDLFKCVFWYRILHLEENHDTRRHLYFPVTPKRRLCRLQTTQTV